VGVEGGEGEEVGECQEGGPGVHCPGRVQRPHWCGGAGEGWRGGVIWGEEGSGGYREGGGVVSGLEIPNGLGAMREVWSGWVKEGEGGKWVYSGGSGSARTLWGGVASLLGDHVVSGVLLTCVVCAAEPLRGG